MKIQTAFIQPTPMVLSIDFDKATDRRNARFWFQEGEDMQVLTLPVTHNDISALAGLFAKAVAAPAGVAVDCVDISLSNRRSVEGQTEGIYVDDYKLSATHLFGGSYVTHTVVLSKRMVKLMHEFMLKFSPKIDTKACHVTWTETPARFSPPLQAEYQYA